MALAKITLIGLSNFTDGGIWEKLELPEGIDKEIAITEILRACGEFPILYPDPNFLTELIGHWSKKWFHNFDRWFKADSYEYEALYNLDVVSTYTDEGSGSDISKGNSSMTNQAASYDSDAFRNTNHTFGDSEGSVEHTSNNVRTEVRQGNQGVTMSQEMLKAEYDVRQWNLYQRIADVFAAEFCISIYE